jgi:hypothetical protein
VATIHPTEPPVHGLFGVFSLGIKWPGLEAEHSPTINVEFKNTLKCNYFHFPHVYGLDINYTIYEDFSLLE